MRIGLVGCGRWGANIARDLLAMGVRLEIADPVTGQYASLHELPPCDAYVVATPSSTHVDVLAELLAFGKPIFCEKPLGTSSSALFALPALARELVFVMDKWRYHPAIEKLAELAREGALGDVRGITTRRLDSTHGHADVDCTWILLPHELSIATDILGGVPAAVKARAQCDNGDVVGMESHLRLDNASVVSMISTRWPSRVRTVMVEFADGSAAFDIGDESAVIVTRTQYRTLATLRILFVPPLRRELEAFIAHAGGVGPTPKASFAEGAETARTIEQLRELAGVDRALPRTHYGCTQGAKILGC